MKQIKKHLPEIIKVFKKNGAVFAYLFGSYAKGRVTKLSDIDFAVYLKNYSDSFDIQLKIMDQLGGILKIEKIDVVILNEAPPLLAHQAATSGKVILDKDPELRFSFEGKTLQTIEDTSYFRNVFYKHLEERVRDNKMGEYPR